MSFLSLVLLNVVMTITTFGAGMLSIKSSIASSHMPKVSALSTGILIGTALGVILPEGISTLYSDDSTLPRLESLGLPASFIIGASLLSGFIVLLVVEQMLNSRDSSTHSTLGSHHSFIPWNAISSIFRSPLTLGLIAHSFVDGFALGASFLDENETVQFLFFFMIVIHKIPTAFSLAVVLLREGVSSIMCKYHLVAFALTTPVSSFLTYFIVLLFNLKSPFFLGVLLLFSAGTFLFSVIHVMKENSDHQNSQPAIASVQSSPLEFQQGGSSFTSIMFTICGMLLPLFFSLTGAD